ncbi:hypothetical protein B0T21DRAFT_382465 [Apiosordaria backusii]|uniref:AA1-like domain-containing protein n=1 Tax=Apiosordaria backusii TaxID=314023 RepID=A0AA40EFB4_9PEZI|nr:hypothetical protein B0T21DRAFT_382465 [Apiosordaria backusii]
MLVVTIISLFLTLSKAASATNDTNAADELGQGPYHYNFGYNTPFISACSNKTVDVKFRWTINGFQYTTTSTFMSPTEESEGKPGVESTYFSFNITNPAIGGTALCNTTVDGPIPTSPVAWRCSKWMTIEDPGFSLGQGPRISLRFDVRNLTIYDGWRCVESRQVSGGNLQYSGRGFAELEFSQCTGASSITGNWEPGQIYSQRTIGCRAEDFKVKPHYLLGV